MRPGQRGRVPVRLRAKSNDKTVRAHCVSDLLHQLTFVVPAAVIWQADLPRNPNGKLDRSGIISRFRPGLEPPGDEE